MAITTLRLRVCKDIKLGRGALRGITQGQLHLSSARIIDAEGSSFTSHLSNSVTLRWWKLDGKHIAEPSLGKGGSQWNYPRSRPWKATWDLHPKPRKGLAR